MEISKDNQQSLRNQSPAFLPADFMRLPYSYLDWGVYRENAVMVFLGKEIFFQVLQLQNNFNSTRKLGGQLQVQLSKLDRECSGVTEILLQWR